MRTRNLMMMNEVNSNIDLIIANLKQHLLFWEATIHV